MLKKTCEIPHNAYVCNIHTKECMFRYILSTISLVDHFLRCSEVTSVASTVKLGKKQTDF